MHYNFPKTKFAYAKDWVPQVEHLLSEADEVAVEFKKWKRMPEGERNSGPLFGEIFDLLHSIETFIGIIPVFVFNQMVKEITEKNRERGYYDPNSSVEESLGGLKTKGITECEPPQVQEVSVEGVGTIYLHTGPQPELPGGSTPSQYALPPEAVELQDLIEHRQMNFSLGNIFKACYRSGECSHSDELRDARKILWFAQREVERLERGSE